MATAVFETVKPYEEEGPPGFLMMRGAFQPLAGTLEMHWALFVLGIGA